MLFCAMICLALMLAALLARAIETIESSDTRGRRSRLTFCIVLTPCIILYATRGTSYKCINKSFLIGSSVVCMVPVVSFASSVPIGNLDTREISLYNDIIANPRFSFPFCKPVTLKSNFPALQYGI